MKVGDYLDSLLDEYYRERRFDIKTGLPKKETLQELGLDSGRPGAGQPRHNLISRHVVIHNLSF